MAILRSWIPKTRSKSVNRSCTISRTPRSFAKPTSFRLLWSFPFAFPSYFGVSWINATCWERVFILNLSARWVQGFHWRFFFILMFPNHPFRCLTILTVVPFLQMAWTWSFSTCAMWFCSLSWLMHFSTCSGIIVSMVKGTPSFKLNLELSLRATENPKVQKKGSRPILSHQTFKCCSIFWLRKRESGQRFSFYVSLTMILGASSK